MASQARQRRTPATDSKAPDSTGTDSAGAGSKPPGGEDAEQLRQFYKDMLLVRRFEERAARAYTEALIGGYCHLNLGEEAAVVGLMAALKPTDYLFTNYREHGYALMRGIDPNKVMAELYGRVDGVSKGWGGSMHMFDLTHRLLGGYGIVGGQIPLATGAALAIDYRGGNDIVMCTMGDGTAAIGAFHGRQPRRPVAPAHPLRRDQQPARYGDDRGTFIRRAGIVAARRGLPDGRRPRRRIRPRRRVRGHHRGS
jgi:pyruvate dehydrogenase E1 component alpha subunit